MHISRLVPEIISIVFEELDLRSYLAARQTCKQWRLIAKTRGIELVQAANIRQGLAEFKVDVHGDHHRYIRDTGLSWPEVISQHEYVGEDFLVLLRSYMVGLDVYLTNRLFLGRLPLDQTMTVWSNDGTQLMYLLPADETLNYIKNDYIIYDLTGPQPCLKSCGEFSYRNIKSGACRKTLPSIVEFGSDNKSTVMVWNPGFVAVWANCDEGTESGHVIFEKRYPSSIVSVQVSDNCEILIVRFTRLGGLYMVNLLTHEEIDIGHYRLDIDMKLYQRNVCLALYSQGNETVMYGSSSKSLGLFSSTRHECKSVQSRESSDLAPRRASIWSYLKYLVTNDRSVYVSLGEASPVDGTNHVIGVLKTESDSLPEMSLVLVQSTPVGMPSFEEFEKYGEGHIGHEEEPEEPEDNSLEDDTSTYVRLVSPMNSHRSLPKWTICPDGTRAASITGRRLLIYCLAQPVIDAAFRIAKETNSDAWLPFRSVELDEYWDVSKLTWVGRDRLVVMYGYQLVTYDIGLPQEKTKSKCLRVVGTYQVVES